MSENPKIEVAVVEDEPDPPAKGHLRADDVVSGVPVASQVGRMMTGIRASLA